MLSFENDGSIKIQNNLTVEGKLLAEERTLVGGLSAAQNLTAAKSFTLNKIDIRKLFSPPGVVLPFAGSKDKLPKGFLLCNGDDYDGEGEEKFKELFKAIGFAFGKKGTNFRVPDLQGYFVRGVSGTSDVDPEKDKRKASAAGGNVGNMVGSVQEDLLKAHSHVVASHEHDITYKADGSSVHAGKNYLGITGHTGYDPTKEKYPAEDYFLGSGKTYSDDPILWNSVWNADMEKTEIGLQETGGTETRPKNAYVNFIIRY